MLEGAKSWIKKSFNTYIIQPVKTSITRIPEPYKTKEFLVSFGVNIFLLLVITS
mgnify:FL=1